MKSASFNYYFFFYFCYLIFFSFTKAPSSAAAAKSLQSCPTLCDPIDGSPSGSAVPGILQARTLEWPFPSPMHESEKSKWSCSVVSDSLWPHGLQPIRLLCPWDFPGKSTGVGGLCLLQPTSTRFDRYLWIFIFIKYVLLFILVLNFKIILIKICLILSLHSF